MGERRGVPGGGMFTGKVMGNGLSVLLMKCHY